MEAKSKAAQFDPSTGWGERPDRFETCGLKSLRGRKTGSGSRKEKGLSPVLSDVFAFSRDRSI